MLSTTEKNLLAAQSSKALEVKEYKLENGLTIWLNEDHSQSKVFGGVVVKAGAKHCPNTGIAHYFEHMMFKGTDKIGTSDYESEKGILGMISDGYDELASTEDEGLRGTIMEEINDLDVTSARFVIPNEFSHLISKYGGSGLNAATSLDDTIYYNTFSPQYMAQWAELNSERLLNPVFRIFRNELETVYEEKNRYRNFFGSPQAERLLARYFGSHPYGYPIQGSAEHLRNPRLTEMRKFFEDYYVASNMALILSGDFDTETTLPILKRTFSRIRSGEAPKKEITPPTPFKGKEKAKVKCPIPFLKLMGLGFRGLPVNHEDLPALNTVIDMLNNENGTGLLDKLMEDRKVMSCIAVHRSMIEAGLLMVGIVPRMMFQTYSGAEKLFWCEIKRIKEGQFSDDVFNSHKQRQYRQYVSSLESINSRARLMMSVFSHGKSWNDHLQKAEKINALTREDVIRAACTYFSDNYLWVTKETGKYPKENLSKPDFTPVPARNTVTESDYAKQLERLPVQDVKPHVIDFEKDIHTVKLNPLATLYTTVNPVTDIFTLNLIYQTGTLEQPRLGHLATYLQFLGTDSLSSHDFRTKLEALGSCMSFEAEDNKFIIRITGFDNHFNETLRLAGDFIAHVKANDKQMRQVINEARLLEKAFFESGDDVAEVLLEKVKYGDESRYLRKLSFSEVKKLKGKDLLTVFATVCQTECDLHYCGTLPADQVTELIKAAIPVSGITIAADATRYRDSIRYDKPAVYFMNMPGASQSIIYGFVKGEVTDDLWSRHASRLFSSYFGSDMSSLMFQEIREFRSQAYRVEGRYSLPPYNLKEKAGDFVAMLSTQSDKTLDAIEAMKSLIYDMPEKPEQIPTIKQSIVNHVNNSYPSFRELSERVADFKRHGFESDPNEALLAGISDMTMKDIIRFHRRNIRLKPIVYVVVGNYLHIDRKKLAAYGEVVELRKKKFYK